MESSTMRLSPLAYACFVLPAGTIVLCYLVTTRFHPDFPVCFPFVSGCASISATARQEPTIHLFRLVMLPMSAVISAYWLAAGAWARGLDGRPSRGLCALGIVSALFLALYAVFLGTEGDIYRLLRRFGTTTYFGGTGVAAILLTARVWPYRLERPETFPPLVLRAMLIDCVLMLGIGLAYIPVAEGWDVSWLENVFEWNYALLLHLHFGLVALLWRRQGLKTVVRFSPM